MVLGVFLVFVQVSFGVFFRVTGNTLFYFGTHFAMYMSKSNDEALKR